MITTTENTIKESEARVYVHVITTQGASTDADQCSCRDCDPNSNAMSTVATGNGSLQNGGSLGKGLDKEYSLPHWVAAFSEKCYKSATTGKCSFCVYNGLRVSAQIIIASVLTTRGCGPARLGLLALLAQGRAHTTGCLCRKVLRKDLWIWARGRPFQEGFHESEVYSRLAAFRAPSNSTNGHLHSNLGGRGKSDLKATAKQQESVV